MDPNKVERLAQTLVSYSLKVKRDDVVLICGDGATEPLLDRLYQALMQQRARPLVRFEGDLSLETRVGPSADSCLNPTGVTEGTPIDCTIGIWSLYRSNRTPTPVAQSVVARDLAAQSEFLQQTASGRIRWAVVLWPTDDAAEISGMSRDEFERLVCDAAMLDQADPAESWEKIAQRQQRLCDRLSGARQLRIWSPAGTDVTIGISGRKWINGCGLSNLPDGEVFSGPVLSQVEGTWCSSFPTVFESRIIVGAKLTIDQGRVVDWSAESGHETLRSLLERDQGSSLVGEIGIGTNKRITRGTGISLLDEKIAGTAHLGIGASYPSTGLVTGSSVHRDFICDLRDGGRIFLDGTPLDPGI